MTHDRIKTETALRIYALLVKHAGASNDLQSRTSFMMAHCTREGCGEYRFIGSLGFGGKFRNDGGGWRVDCYREDETEERLRAIETTNAALKGLWEEQVAQRVGG